MPELPEVETTRRGIAPHLAGKIVTSVTLRESRLRWPVPKTLVSEMTGRRLGNVTRRGKYLIVDVPGAVPRWLMLHLGMSGRLRVVPQATPARKHDHVDICLDSGQCLRFTDPRRFGSLHWLSDSPMRHPLIASLGPEPLGPEFDGRHLFDRSRGRRVAVKQFLMDSRVVVGVGNIYANEALYRAGVLPQRAAGRVSLKRYEGLAESVRHVLTDAIQRGGTTLRDYSNASGEQGFFQLDLKVYGRQGEHCVVCDGVIRQLTLGQRSTFWCPRCQR